MRTIWESQQNGPSFGQRYSRVSVSVFLGCFPTCLDTLGIRYTQVKGFLIAEQFGSMVGWLAVSLWQDAFNPGGLDTTYVDGMSLTYNATAGSR